MEIKLSQYLTFLNKSYENLFKKKMEFIAGNTNFISKYNTPTYTPKTIPKFKTKQNLFYRRKMVILNEF